MNEDFWKTVDASRDYSEKRRRTGALNVALLFGTAAIALSLIITPVLANRSGNSQPRYATVPDDIDNILTGSIKRTEAGKTYTIRNSILPDHKNGPCVVQGYNRSVSCQ
jgi:hypothetical protein